MKWKQQKEGKENFSKDLKIEKDETQKKVNGEENWIEKRETERIVCWQIEVYWAFDSKIIYSKGQSGAGLIQRAILETSLSAHWNNVSMANQSHVYKVITQTSSHLSAREARTEGRSRQCTFHSPACLKVVHPDLGTGSLFPAICNRLKWSLIRTWGNSQPLSLTLQCYCWGFSCTRAGGAIRG